MAVSLPALIGASTKLARRGRWHVGLCPFHDERTPSFHVYDHFHCFGCGAHGDAIEFVRKFEHVSFEEAIARLDGKAGLSRGNPVKQARKKPKQEKRTATYAARVLNESQPIAGRVTETYVRIARGLGDEPLPPELRFHPAVWSRDTNSHHPALIIPCFDGERLARIQAILLNPATGGKADVANPKLTFGAGASHIPASFAASVPDQPIFLTEGPEDAITLNVASGARADASLGSGSLHKPRYPAGTRLIIVGDNTAEGQAKANAAILEHRGRGCDVIVVFPPAGVKDANELLQREGIKAVRAWLACAPLLPCGGRVRVPGGKRDYTTSNLPAYYEAPEETRENAKAMQDSAMRAHLEMASRIQSARHEIDRRRAEAIASASGDDALQPSQKAKITKQLTRAVARQWGFGNRIPKLPACLFSGAQGSGKTSFARKYIAEHGAGSVWWFTELTTAKAEEEFVAYILEDGLNKPPAMLIRGRSQVDPKRPGHLMCDRAATAEQVAKAGLSVITNLCNGCQLAALCGNQRQRREAEALKAAGDGAVFFMASEYVFVHGPAPTPDHAVLDESLILAAIKVSNVSLTEIRTLNAHNWGSWGAAPDRSAALDQANRTLHAICDAIDTPSAYKPEKVARLLDMGIQPPVEPMALSYLRLQSISKGAIEDLNRIIGDELEARRPVLSGTMSDEAITDAIEAADAGALGNAKSLVTAVLREIDRQRDTLTGVAYHPEGTPNHPDLTVRISRLRTLIGLGDASLTLLDGTGDINLSRKLFGSHLEHVHVPFPRQAHVTGTIGKGYSRQSIIGMDRHGRAIENRQGDAANLRGDLAKIFATLPSGSLICGTLKVVDAMDTFGVVPPGTLAAHFSALRGLNTWEHAPGGLFIGAERISIGDLEDRGRAYLVDDDAPFVSMDEPAPKGWGSRYWPYKATRMRRMRDGTLQPVEVEVHPDPRVQAVHEQIREAELVQGIDRPRPLWNERQIILLNDLCLDVTYDLIYRHRELVAGGNPIERIFRKTGFVPLTPADLHRLYPSDFRTVRIAERALANYPPNPRLGSIWDMGVIRYRREGQNGREARLLVDLKRYPDPRAAAIERLGPLKSVAGVSCKGSQPPFQEPASAPAPAERPVAAARPTRRPARAAPAVPRAPFWMTPIELLPAPPWTPPAWIVSYRGGSWTCPNRGPGS